MSGESVLAAASLETGIEDAPDQQGEDEIAAAVAVGAEQAVEADLAGGAERGGDMAVRQAAGDGEGVVLGGDDGAALEHAAQAFDIGAAASRRGCTACVCAPCRPRGSSRAAGWRAASSGSGRLRYTWHERRADRPGSTRHKRVITWLQIETG